MPTLKDKLEGDFYKIIRGRIYEEELALIPVYEAFCAWMSMRLDKEPERVISLIPVSSDCLYAAQSSTSSHSDQSVLIFKLKQLLNGLPSVKSQRGVIKQLKEFRALDHALTNGSYSLFPFLNDFFTGNEIGMINLQVRRNLTTQMKQWLLEQQTVNELFQQSFERLVNKYSPENADYKIAVAAMIDKLDDMRDLNFGDFCFDSSQLDIIVDALPYSHSIKTLNFSEHKNLSFEALIRLIKALECNDSVVSLNFEGVKIGQYKSRSAVCSNYWNGTENPIIKGLEDLLRDDGALLTNLNLSNTALNEKDIKSVFDSVSGNKSLLSLDLSHNCIPGTSNNSWLDWLKFNNTLLALNLSHTNLYPQITKQLITVLADNQSLKTLDLTRCNFSNDGFTALVSTLKVNNSLEVLKLIGTNITTDRAKMLAGALSLNASLKELDLMENENLEPEGVIAIFDSLRNNESLASLMIETGSDTPSYHAIFSALQSNHTLFSLKSGGVITNERAIILAEFLQTNPSLKSLDISFNNISDIGMQRIAHALRHNTSIHQLDISSNHFGERGLDELMDTMHTNQSIWALKIGYASINDQTVCYVARMLQNNVTLRSLQMPMHMLSEEGALQLAQALEFNSTLIELDLSSSTIDPQSPVLQHIKNLLERNKIRSNEQALPQEQKSQLHNIIEWAGKQVLVSEQKIEKYHVLIEQLQSQELHDEVVFLTKLVEDDPVLFAQRVRERCRERQRENAGTCLSWKVTPDSVCNRLYWLIAQIIFKQPDLTIEQFNNKLDECYPELLASADGTKLPVRYLREFYERIDIYIPDVLLHWLLSFSPDQYNELLSSAKIRTNMFRYKETSTLLRPGALTQAQQTAFNNAMIEQMEKMGGLQRVLLFAVLSFNDLLLKELLQSMTPVQRIERFVSLMDPKVITQFSFSVFMVSLAQGNEFMARELLKSELRSDSDEKQQFLLTYLLQNHLGDKLILLPFLKTISEERRLQTIRYQDKEGNTLLHLFTNNLSELFAILDTLLLEENKENVLQIPSRAGVIFASLLEIPHPLLKFILSVSSQNRLAVLAMITKTSVEERQNIFAFLSRLSEDDREYLATLKDQKGGTLFQRLAMTFANLHHYLSLFPEQSREKILKNAGISNEATSAPYTKLMEAARDNHLSLVEMCLSSGWDVNERSLLGSTPVMFAAQAGHLEMVKYLVSQGAILDVETISGWSTFAFAVQSGNVELIKWLIDDVQLVVTAREVNVALNNTRDIPIFGLIWERYKAILDDSAVYSNEYIKQVKIQTLLAHPNTKLKTLHLSGCPINRASVIALVEFLKTNTSLESLELSDCKLGNEGAAIILEALNANPGYIKKLDLSDNDLGEESGLQIADLLKNKSCNIQSLSISGNPDIGCTILFVLKNLKKNQSLIDFNCSHVALRTDRHMRAVIDVIETNKVMNRFDLHHNEFTEDQDALIAMALRKNAYIRYLCLGGKGYSLSPERWTEIQRELGDTSQCIAMRGNEGHGFSYEDMEFGTIKLLREQPDSELTNTSDISFRQKNNRSGLFSRSSPAGSSKDHLIYKPTNLEIINV